jgi:hypothetical protein|tara:strand:+ start:1378 stop:2670 length:1293 start_codon:yes stop_codon:yes gene_type:complete
MAQQIKFDDKLLLKGNSVILDNGASHGELKSKNGTLWIKGDLIIDGTTTTINTATLTVDDKNIELGSIASPSDSLADGGGITLKGDSDKTILWVNSTDSWDFNQKVKSTNGFEGNVTGNLTGDSNGTHIGGLQTNGQDLISSGLSELADVRIWLGSINDTTIGAITPSTGAFTTITGALTGTVSSIANHDTDDLAEGSTNLYYTQARVDARYATLHNNADAGTLDGQDGTYYLDYTNFTNTPAAGVVYTAGTNVSISGGNVISSTDTITDITGSIIPATDNTSDLGSSAKKYANIYGHSVTATFADLAERYATDVPYESGTVVVFGGEAEITTTREPGDVSVAGVISTNPALKMNAEAGNSQTHPYVALRGRVPCKMIGPVSKGDLIVTADNEPGYAQSIGKENAGRSVFAKSIQTDLTVGKKVIEVSIL